MKKSVFILLLAAVIVFPLQAQKVSNYTYKLDNGIVVKMEKGWGNVWVQQSQAAFAPSEEQQSVVASVRTMGDLTSGSTIKMTSAGKDVRMKDAAPGTYDLKITSKLSGKPGTITFDVAGIVVKPKMKTTVTVTLYNYQIIIDEVAAANKGLAGYESRIIKFKGNSDQSPKCGIPSFYQKGLRDKTIAPDEKVSDLNGKIKPGTYDVLLAMDVCGYNQKIWLENFTLKSDVTYKITANLNAGEITYAGLNKDVKKLRMYPAGTADRLQGVAKPDKTSEIIVYDPANLKYPCSPGSYDILIEIGTTPKYEWKKGIVVRTGGRVEVK